MKHGTEKHQAKRKAATARGLSDELKMPPGALRANCAKQVSKSVMPIFRAWYTDYKFTCRTCGNVKTWTAHQQRWWYEVAGGEIESTAIQCRECRQKQKKANAETTSRTRAFRMARAEKRALELSQKLAQQGLAGFAVLDQPLSALRVPVRTIRALTEHGYKTIGDVVQHDSGIHVSRLWAAGLQAIRMALAELGLSMVGAPVPRELVTRSEMRPSQIQYGESNPS